MTDDDLEELSNTRFFQELGRDLKEILQQQRTIFWQRLAILVCAVLAVAMFGAFLWRVNIVLDDLRGVADDSHTIQTDNHSILTEIQKVTNVDAVKQRSQATLDAIRNVILCIENNDLRIVNPSVPVRAGCPSEQGR